MDVVKLYQKGASWVVKMQMGEGGGASGEDANPWGGGGGRPPLLVRSFVHLAHNLSFIPCRFSGAISGAVYVSILPCLGIMQRQRMEGKLTKWSVLLNGSICVIGVANLIAQFFVKE